MTQHLRDYRNGFAWGITQVTKPDNPGSIGFGILRLQMGKTHTFEPKMEWACVLLAGTVEVRMDGQTFDHTRSSLFEDAAFAVHVCRSTKVVLTAKTDIEVAIYTTANTKRFPSEIYIADEEASLRPIIGPDSSHPNAQLLLSEAIASSNSELPTGAIALHHYRFRTEGAQASADVGSKSLSIKNFDTVTTKENACAITSPDVWCIQALRAAEMV